jgi:type IV pilus assembly protein PilC
MTVYNYEAYTKSGKKRKATIEALTTRDAVTVLEGRSLAVIKIEPDKSLTFFERGPGVSQLALFFRQLSLMQSAGINMQDSLNSARDTVSNKKLRNIALELENKTGQQGMYLHEALADYPAVFSPLIVAFVRASESGGDVKQLSRLADMMNAQLALTSKLKKAVQQPAFTFIFSLIVMYGLTVNVIPQFAGILKGIGGQLPPLTAFMMALADLLKNPLFIAGLVVVAVIIPVLLGRFVKTPNGRLQKDRLLTRTPKVKDFVKVYVLAQTTSTLASLMENGLGIEESLTLCAQTAGNVIYEQIFMEAVISVRQGNYIADVLEDYPQYIPDDYARIIRSGETGGQFGQLLLQAVMIYKTRVDETVDTLANSINPVLTIFIGGMVTFILLSVFLPMSSIISNLSK